MAQDIIEESFFHVVKEKMAEDGFVTTYIHPRIEGIKLKDAFEGVISSIAEEGYTNLTYGELAEKYREAYEYVTGSGSRKR